MPITNIKKEYGSKYMTEYYDPYHSLRLPSLAELIAIEQENEARRNIILNSETQRTQPKANQVVISQEDAEAETVQ